MQKVKLGDILPYEQPSAYIVESTKYDDSYKTPVLTAGKSFIIGYTNESSGIYDKLPCIIFDDFTTATQYVNFPFKVKSSAMKILNINNEETNIKYIFFLLQTINIDTQTHKRYWISEFSKIEIPLPPLEEQEKIVQKIEELFSHLDKGIEELKTVQAKLKVYRQAVLKEAFDCVTSETEITEIASVIDPHPSHRTPPESSDGVPYIGIGDIDYGNNCINFKNSRKISKIVLAEHIDRYTLVEGDFIIGKIGTIGKPFILPITKKYTLSANVLLIKPNQDKILSKYLFFQFASNYIEKQISNETSATSQPAFGILKARKLKIKFCNHEQQKQIVEEIEARLSICDSVEETIKENLIKAENLKQAILQKAFKGDLV